LNLVSKPERRSPIGAEVQPTGGTPFRVWAPRAATVDVVVESGPGAPAAIPLEPEPNGYHAGFVSQAAVGTRYRFRLNGQGRYPDPASRYQPDGPHGSSQVVDPAAFAWRDAQWPGVSIEGQVIDEMHIETFAREGTWAAAQRELAACGVTVIEVMPVADFPDRFGWGYDGVGLFAPVWLYGQPNDFRRFVDDAHACGPDDSVLAAECLLLRFFDDADGDRLLVVNLGRDLHLNPAPEPLLAPPEGMRGQVLWSSEDPKYGGTGTPPLDSEENWRFPGHAAVALCPIPREPHKDA